MTTYTVERVVQSRRFTETTTTSSMRQGIGSASQACSVEAFWWTVTTTCLRQPCEALAESLALQIPSGTSFTWLQGKNSVHELVRRAERAAFTFFGRLSCPLRC
jgi:hypothetical protein